MAAIKWYCIRTKQQASFYFIHDSVHLFLNKTLTQGNVTCAS